MKLLHVALLYLGSATFLGADAASLDVASAFRRKWARWALSRAKRDVPAAPAPAGPAAVQPLVRPEDVKEEAGLWHLSSSSSREAAHVRVKRYRHSLGSFPHFQAMRMGCRFGTCTVQQLAHQIYQLTDKEKDGAAPASKISPPGYGVMFLLDMDMPRAQTDFNHLKRSGDAAEQHHLACIIPFANEGICFFREK
ncbi:PREDICTED: ADM [Gavialis gangeticus]|uniref:ADM n=1 Tax=Gavialis gangeticus TaxID=94835 RepID=UPI00092F1D71|nr:PREDICTED: ADM [Gavialis gangeticus]